MPSRNEVTKELHRIRREANRCIYDRRDHGGEAHGDVVGSGRCAVCLSRKHLSAKKKTRERAIERTKELLRGAKDELYIARLQRQLVRLERELREVVAALSQPTNALPAESENAGASA